MDAFPGFKTVAVEELPEAVTIMDPFHVVALALRHWTAAANASSKTPAVPLV